MPCPLQRLLPLLLFLLLGGGTLAERILLTNVSYPHLTTETNALLRWGEAQRLQTLHGARWIEVAPRGIRIVPGDSAESLGARWSPPTPCVAVPDALCATPQGLLFPSPSPLALGFFNNYVVVSPALARRTLTRDPIALAYATEDACAMHGIGRVLMAEPAPPSSLAGNYYYYTATACDVMEGHLVALYDTFEGTVRLAPQTLGPMGYCVVLLQAVACLYFATSTSTPAAAAIAAATLAMSNALVAGVHGIPFLLAEDAAFFWAQNLFAFATALLPMPDNNNAAQDACIHALSATACAVYRTTENAYEGIVGAVLLVRAWAKLLRATPSAAIDSALTWGLVLWGARLGVAPQLGSPRERWPFFAGLALYISLAFAVMMQNANAAKKKDAGKDPLPAKKS